MNKKIFTLLTGAILMFSVAFSVSAQTGGPIWNTDANKLFLGDTAKTLNLHANNFYHLQIDSIGFSNGVSASSTTGILPQLSSYTVGGGEICDSLVLYLGRLDGYNQLFIDSLNHARRDWGHAGNVGDAFKTDSKGEESAASLWCTVVYNYAALGGQNVTFDFVNKQQKSVLEVSVEDEDFTIADMGVDNQIYTANAGDNAPFFRDAYRAGSLSKWGYSDVIGGNRVRQSMPLYTYTGRGDTVAVLCLNVDTLRVAEANPTAVEHKYRVVAKLVPAKYVNPTNKDFYGRVNGILYFTLREPTPFLMNVTDVNSRFGADDGTNPAVVWNFNMPGVSDYENPFLSGNLQAKNIPLDLYGSRVVTDAWIHYDSNNPYVAPNFPRDSLTGSYLDSLGYLWLYSAAGGSDYYLRVAREYWSKSLGSTKFLKLEQHLGAPGELRGVGGYSLNSVADSLFFGQYAWRLVYNPMEDNIYINAYQAAYLPTNYPVEAMTYFGIPDNADGWTSDVVQARFTFYADTSALDPNVKNSASDSTWSTLLENVSNIEPWWRAATAKLRDDDSTSTFFREFSQHQKLYVTSQDLVDSLNYNVVTLGTDINQQINFNLYAPCQVPDNDNRVSLDPDVYLIRNARGQFLHVPLYSVHDSAEWRELEKDEHPELLPSFQWVIVKRYYYGTGSEDVTGTSQVTITNREFPWLKFENVQLTKYQTKLDLYPKDYDWNGLEKTNSVSVSWAEYIAGGANADTASFIKVPEPSKTNPYLGYTYIKPEVTDTALYAFNYMNFIDSNRYLGWNNDNDGGDSVVYANYDSYYDRLYFRLDTIAEAYGQMAPYGYTVKGSRAEAQLGVGKLAQLVRQPYRLLYEDPYKFICYNDMYLTNGVENNYQLGSKGDYKDILGRPAFYLRNVYNNTEKGEDYFALVQIFDWTTSTIYPLDENQRLEALRAYVLRMFGEYYASALIDNLELHKDVGFINPGIFVAAVDFDGSTKLKVQVRADNESRVSTFRLEEVIDPIYRRFNTTKEGYVADDTPDTVRFFTINDRNYFLFENQGSLADQRRYWTNPSGSLSQAFDGGKNYLGLVNEYANREEMAKRDIHTAIFVDTAFVNRGTGHIKPQYMLAVRPDIYTGGLGCDDKNVENIPLLPYVIADYLINANDSAHLINGRDDDDYMWDGRWERMVFTRAIHANDSLYILNDVDIKDKEKYRRVYTPIKGNDFELNVSLLHQLVKEGLITAVDLANNRHKDCVFSFRLAERHNPNDFLIESETTNRDTVGGPMLRPCNGGWLKIQNGVPVISRGLTNVDLIGEGDIFDVEKANDEAPVSNEPIAAAEAVKIVGGNASVSILNAAGKAISITNTLGQILARTVLTSDNATVPVAASGIVIVTIEGVSVGKTLVK